MSMSRQFCEWLITQAVYDHYAHLQYLLNEIGSTVVRSGVVDKQRQIRLKVTTDRLKFLTCAHDVLAKNGDVEDWDLERVVSILEPIIYRIGIKFQVLWPMVGHHFSQLTGMLDLAGVDKLPAFILPKAGIWPQKLFESSRYLSFASTEKVTKGQITMSNTTYRQIVRMDNLVPNDGHLNEAVYFTPPDDDYDPELGIVITLPNEQQVAVYLNNDDWVSIVISKVADTVCIVGLLRVSEEEGDYPSEFDHQLYSNFYVRFIAKIPIF